MSATDFPPNKLVDITLQAEPIDQTTTDANGTISIAVTIPADWGRLPGKYPLEVSVDSDGAISAGRLFTVTG